MALVAFGSTSTRAIVASAPASWACWFAASTVCAKVSIGSRRSASRVVPAWSPCPVKSNRQRPCGQIALATPTGTSRARPCSMCSSTSAVTRRTKCRSAPAGTAPSASPKVIPSLSVSAAALAGSIAPVSSREPRQGRPNRPPSSSTNAAIAIGRCGRRKSARSRSTARNALTMPSGPS